MKRLALICAAALLAAAEGRAEGSPPAARIVIRPIVAVPAVAPPAKRPAAGTPRRPETVRIGERDYPVPAPWAGNRVRVPEETAANLVLIPKHLTLNGGDIALRREATAALARMAAAAKEEGIALQVDSGYRSANYQRQIWERRLAEGASFAAIARHTAPPGYSRHSLGVAVDFTPSSGVFHKTPAYAWLKRRAGEFGFFETYGRGNSFGIVWEPWHWEYRISDEERESAKATLAAKKAEEEAAKQKPKNPWPEPFETARRFCAETLPRLAERNRTKEERPVPEP